MSFSRGLWVLSSCYGELWVPLELQQWTWGSSRVVALTDIPLEYSTQLGVPFDLCKARLELRQGTQSSPGVVVGVCGVSSPLYFWYRGLLSSFWWDYYSLILRGSSLVISVYSALFVAVGLLFRCNILGAPL